MEIGLIVAIVLLAAVVLALTISRARDRQPQSTAIHERLDSLNRGLGQVTGQFSSYQETLSDVHERLGHLSQSSQRMLEMGQDMQRLKDILAAPTLRGEIGELMLEELLRQTLPAGFYETQHTFRNRQRVDAVIRLKEGLVPIDSKFPLEGFRRLTEAATNGRRGHMGQFRTDVKRHIDDIAAKYICPGETLDFALMYIPAENVYYEIVLKAKGQDDILTYAWSKRVIPTSPNTLYAYLRVIAMGLRGLQVEENARQMIDSLSRLSDDFDRFADDYRVLGTHLGHAQAKYGEALPKLDSIRRDLPGRLSASASVGELDKDVVDESIPPASGSWNEGPSDGAVERGNS